MRLKVVRKRLFELRDRVPPLGTRHTIASWVREEEGEGPQPWMEMVQYSRLLSLLPDKVVDSLERARLERAGIGPMLRAGLGYSELLSAIIVDGTQIASSSAEARLVPAQVIPKNYMQPGGIPGRSLRAVLRGRMTTLTTAATMTGRCRIGTTDVITGTTLAASSAITMDTAAQTASIWEMFLDICTRSVGSGGTVFAMGKFNLAGAALTIGQQTNAFMGSAGANTPAAVTFDTTIDEYLQFTGQWSLATAYSIQSHIYTLEALN